jgi:hypothetical protein
MKIPGVTRRIQPATWWSRSVILAALSAALGSLIACAGDDALDERQPDEESGATDFEIASFARDARISESEAAERLSWQMRVPDLGLLAAHRLGTAFGGIWVDSRDGDRVKVGVVTSVPASGGLAIGAPDWYASRAALDLDDADPPPETIELAARLREPVTSPMNTRAQILERAADAVAGMGLATATDLVEVRHSWSELESANAWIADEIEKLGPDSGVIAGIRTDLNAIELRTPRGREPDGRVREFIAYVRLRLGDGVVVSDYEGAAQARACRYPYCDPPLRGGNLIHNSPAGCTSAFVAGDWPFGNRCLVPGAIKARRECVAARRLAAGRIQVGRERLGLATVAFRSPRPRRRRPARLSRSPSCRDLPTRVPALVTLLVAAGIPSSE